MPDTTVLTEHSTTLTRATLLVRESRRLMNDGWRAAAASRRRVFRRPGIAGGSDDDQLRTSIRTRLADQTLPQIDGRAWAGNGSGLHICICCGDTIRRLDQEFEPAAAAGLHAHGPCFTVWLAESVGQRVYDRRPGHRHQAELN